MLQNNVVDRQFRFLVVSVLLIASLFFLKSAPASVPFELSSEPNIVLVAALGSSLTLASGSQLEDYRVKKQPFEEYEFTEAILAIMLKKIDANKGRDSILVELNRVTPGQKALYAVQLMRETVTEYGFIGYLESERGDLIPEVKRGLKIFGAKEYLKLFNTALAVFKKEKLLITKLNNRQAVLNRLSNEDKYKIFAPVDEKFENLEDELRLQKHVMKYVNNHPSYFYVK